MRQVEQFLDGLPQRPPELVLRRGLNETWFSDTLAWLLDPKGSHGLGVRFLRSFLVMIGRARSGDGRYKRTKAHLKFGRGGAGTGCTTFDVGNAAVVREFWLSGGIGRNAESGRFCDVVVIDLDREDGPHKHALHVQLLGSYSFAMQTRHRSGKARFEKILVPYGAHPDQVRNLLDVAARDVYHRKFARKKGKGLNRRHSLRGPRSAEKERHVSLFRFLFRRRFELSVLFAVSDYVR